MGRKTPLPTPIRTYGASILGLIAPTELDTRHPLSKILDPPLSLAYGQPAPTVSLLVYGRRGSSAAAGEAIRTRDKQQGGQTRGRTR